MEFFPAFTAPVVSAGTSLCACNCFYCRTSGTEKAGLSGDSGAVGGKSHKGKLFPVFCGKKKTVIFIMQGTFCTADFPFSGWAAGLDPERRLFLAFWTGRKWDFCCVDFLFFWNMAVMEQKWLEKRNALGSLGRVCRNHFSGNLHLSSFCWLAEFLCGEFSYQSIGKSGEKTIPCLSMFFTTRSCRPCPDALKAEGACLQRDTISMG